MSAGVGTRKVAYLEGINTEDMVMGLDILELTMAYEEEFGIIMDEPCATPGLVADYLYTRVRRSNKDSCLSQQGFYKIRKELVDQFGLKRREIRPNTKIRNLLGDEIKKNWQSLHKAVGTKYFPPLERSRSFFMATVFGVPAIVVLPLYIIDLPLQIIGLFFFLGVVLSNYITHKMGDQIPGKLTCISDFIPYITCSKSKVWSYGEILEKVIDITSEELGIERQLITRDSNFVDELGAG